MGQLYLLVHHGPWQIGSYDPSLLPKSVCRGCDDMSEAIHIEASRNASSVFLWCRSVLAHKREIALRSTCLGFMQVRPSPYSRLDPRCSILLVLASSLHVLAERRWPSIRLPGSLKGLLPFKQDGESSKHVRALDGKERLRIWNRQSSGRVAADPPETLPWGTQR